MGRLKTRKYICVLCFLAFLAIPRLIAASEYRGQVVLNDLPVPGASVTATKSDKKLSVVTDEQGLYSFPDLSDGSWTVEVQMTGFSSVKRDVTIGPNAPPAKWELKLLPLDQVMTETMRLGPVPGVAAARPEPKADKPAEAPMPTQDGAQAPSKTRPMVCSLTAA